MHRGKRALAPIRLSELDLDGFHVTIATLENTWPLLAMTLMHFRVRCSSQMGLEICGGVPMPASNVRALSLPIMLSRPNATKAQFHLLVSWFGPEVDHKEGVDLSRHAILPVEKRGHTRLNPPGPPLVEIHVESKLRVQASHAELSTSNALPLRHKVGHTVPHVEREACHLQLVNLGGLSMDSPCGSALCPNLNCVEHSTAGLSLELLSFKLCLGFSAALGLVCRRNPTSARLSPGHACGQRARLEMRHVKAALLLTWLPAPQPIKHEPAKVGCWILSSAHGRGIRCLATEEQCRGHCEDAQGLEAEAWESKSRLKLRLQLLPVFASAVATGSLG